MNGWPASRCCAGRCEAFAGYPVQVVIGPGQEELGGRRAGGLDVPAPVIGGATRQESVRLGLEALADGRAGFCADP